MPDIELVKAIELSPFSALVDYYASCLDHHPRAIAYLKMELNLTLEAAKAQNIGFSDRSLGKQLPSADGQRGRVLRKRLKTLGVLKATGHEALRGCVTIPVLDENGKVIGIQAIRIDKKAKGPKNAFIGNTSQSTASQYTGSPCPASRREAGGERPTEQSSSVLELKGVEEEANADETPTNMRSKQDDCLHSNDFGLTAHFDDRSYRIRGLEKNNAVGSLKVNILASRDDLVHLDAIDLVKARSRASFIKATAAELFVDSDIIKRDIGKLLLKLEILQEQRISEAQKPTRKFVDISPREKEQAIQLLRDPNLMQRIVADMTACGVVGEDTNKLAGYLAATSRKLKTPLAIVIQSSSSAGKTSLMDAILDMMPGEEVNRMSGLTGRSLYYVHSDDIRHKIVAVCEDEGIRQAAYALKILQSDGELRHLTTERGDDGRMRAVQYHVEGPTQIMLTTTAIDVDEELINRCLALAVDETKMQTDAIQTRQRAARTHSAESEREASSQLRTLHRNAQRLIRPLRIYNPYAPQLTFRNDKIRTRRDHQKYLTLIDTIALLHQHQRKLDERGVNGEMIECVHVEISDIETANRLAGEILGRSLDELSPQTRNCLLLTEQYVSREAKAKGVSRHAFRFTRRELRESIGWSDFQVRMHVSKLVDLEYLIVHRGKQGRRYVYELLYRGEGQSGTPFFMGLTDPKSLAAPSIPTSTSSIETATVSTARASGERDVSVAS